jgi:hypothetical protein
MKSSLKDRIKNLQLPLNVWTVGGVSLQRCYYFEKGDLDRQLGNWSEAVNLYETAVNKGFTTDYGVELMPFIEAYAREGKGDQALALTRMAAVNGAQMHEYVCDNWIRISGDIQTNDSVKNAHDTVYKDYACAVIGQ